MSFWNPENIKSVTGAAWLMRPGPASREPEGLSTDTRTLRPGQVFLALRGAHHDANTLAPAAARAGSPLIILDRREGLAGVPERGVGVLLVPDSRRALVRLGAAYRRSLDSTRVIGVGGSNGKTTTCRLIDAVLSGTLRGSSSPKSFNNDVGVPLTILGARRADQYLVCEMGTNAPGEIVALAAVVEPDIGVITSIGREHLEGLGSVRGVVQEEVTLLSTLRPGGLALVNADSPALVEAARAIVSSLPKVSMLTFGFAEHADIRVTNAESTTRGTTFTLNDSSRWSLPLLGLHNASNAAAAIGVARRLGVPAETIRGALGDAKGAPMRLERREVAGVVFINDAYNANPESVMAAVTTFAQVARGARRRVVILGDMLELGEGAPDHHREVGDFVAAHGAADVVILVGRLSAFTGERLGRSLPPDRVSHFAGTEDAGAIAGLLRPGDVVLLKGSRGMRLERLIDAWASAASVIGEPRMTGVAGTTPGDFA